MALSSFPNLTPYRAQQGRSSFGSLVLFFYNLSDDSLFDVVDDAHETDIEDFDQDRDQLATTVSDHEAETQVSFAGARME